MGRPDKIAETDLYLPVRQIFEEKGYVIRSEVKSCDITATKDEELIVIELKKGFTLELLIQAIRRQKFADMVYVAIPKPKKIIFSRKWQEMLLILQKLNLGLILVEFVNAKAHARIALEPGGGQADILEKRKRKDINKEIRGRSHEGNRGGSRGEKLLTAYREMSIQIACCMEKYGTLSPAQLAVYGTDKNKTGNILQNNYYGWFVRESRGKYNLSDNGRKALEEYQELVAYYRGIYDTDR